MGLTSLENSGIICKHITQAQSTRSIVWSDLPLLCDYHGGPKTFYNEPYSDEAISEKPKLQKQSPHKNRHLTQNLLPWNNL